MKSRYLPLVIAAICCSLFAHAGVWQETTKSAEQSATLEAIIKSVKTTKNPVVVFDLDATLYDDRMRSVGIIQEYAKANNVPQLNALKPEHVSSWVMTEYLVRDAKIDQALVQRIADELKTFWAGRFFTSEYAQKYDTPLPGAVDFVNELYNNGAYIAYVTGRNTETMREGTEYRLKTDGFPFGKERTILLMKDKRTKLNVEDFASHTEYEAEVARLDKDAKAKRIGTLEGFGTVVASFENQPAHANLYFNAFHNKGIGKAVFLDTYCAPDSPKLEQNIVSVRGFLR